MLKKYIRITALIVITIFTMVLAGNNAHATDCVIDFRRFDGSEPFDADNNPGNDTGSDNGIIRVNDVLAMQFLLSTSNGSEQNVNFSFDLEPGLQLDALPVFCLGAADGVTPVSTLTGDVSTGISVLCNVGDFALPTASQYTFPVKVNYDQPNGSTVGYSNIKASGDTACAYEDATPVTFDVSGAPKLDAVKSSLYASGRAKGPNGEDGVIYDYGVHILMRNGSIGSELVASDLTILDDLSGITPNARLYQGWTGAPASACGPNGSGGYNFNVPFPYIDVANGGPGAANGNSDGIPDRSVADSGTISCTESGQDVTITISGADLTGVHSPIQTRAGSAIAADQVWLVTHTLRVWYPLQDILDDYDPNVGGMPTTNTYDLQATSISGQANVDPIPSNNTRNYNQPGFGPGGATYQWYRQFYSDPAPGSVLPGASAYNNAGSVFNGYKWYGYVDDYNQAFASGIDRKDSLICETFDNSKQILTECDANLSNSFSNSTTYGYHDTPYNGLLSYMNGSPREYPQTAKFEYASGSFGIGAACEDSDTDTGWFSDPNLVPGGLNAVNKVRVIADHNSPPINGSTSYNRLITCFEPSATATLGDRLGANAYVNRGYGGGSEGIKVSSHDITVSPATNSYNRLHVYATLSGVQVRVDKEEVTEAVSVLAGNTITYELDWTLTLPVDATAFSDVTVEDTLGAGLEYVVGSASVPPSSVVYNNDGTSTVTWNFYNVQVNQVQPNITYDAVVLTTAEDASAVVNTAVVSAPTDTSTLADRSDVESLVVINPTLFSVDKEVLTPVVGADGLIEFRLSYLNNSNSAINNVRIIDVLPDPSLSNPVSVYAGGYDLFSLVDQSGAGTFYYSKDLSTTHVLNPEDPANDLATGSITWCTAFDGTGTATNGNPASACPANAAEVTAFYFLRPVIPGKTGPEYINVVLDSNNIGIDETFANKFGLTADELLSALVTETVVARIGGSDLELTKTVDNSASRPGGTIVYTISVENKGNDANSGVVVSDILPAGTPGVTYVTDDSGGSYDPVTGVWNVGAIGVSAGSNIATLNITAIANGAIGDSFINYAEITEAFLIDPDSFAGTDRDNDDLGDGLPDDDEDNAIVTLSDFDFGDAPVSYGVTFVGITPDLNIYLGSVLPDGDENHASDGTVATPNAIDDDAEGGTINEEDAMVSMVSVSSGGAASITIPVFNTSGGPSTLTGYIDFNFDGDFTDPGETATAVANSGDTNVVLNFTGVTTTATSAVPLTTIARLDFRDANDFGEIEDSQVQITIADVNILKSVDTLTQNDDGTVTVSFDIETQNTSTVNLYDLLLTDPLSGFGTLSAATTAATLPYGEYFISAAPSVTSVSSGSVVTINTAYDGSADVNLVAPVTGDILEGLDKFNVGFEITFRPDLNNPTSLQNQAVFSGDTSEDGTADGQVSDTSDDPADPADDDPNGDDNPDDPTDVTFTPEPVIGLSKNADLVTPNADGTYTIDFSFVLRNYGNVPLYDIQITDDLTTIPNGFGSYVASTPTNPGEYTISTALAAVLNNDAFPTGNITTLIGNLNPVYTGNGAGPASNFFSPTTGNRLDVDDAIDLTFSITVFPDFTDSSIDYTNQAEASGNSLEGDDTSQVTDLSDDGTDPDEDGDDDPTEDTNNDPTETGLDTFINAQPGIAKAYTGLTSNGNGTFSLTVTLNIENLGNVPLYDVQITDDLTFGFGTFTPGALAQGQYNITPITWSGTAPDLTLNTAYNGDATQTLLTLATGDALDIAETAAITFDITFFPDASAANFGTNTATISGDSIEDGTPANDPNGGSDISDNGTDPDPSGNGNPSETPPTDPACIADDTAAGCEDDPTTLMLPIIGVSKVVDNGPTDNGDGTFTVSYDLFVENMGNTPIYDVQLLDDVSAGFGNHVAATPTVAGSYTVSTAPSFGAVGSGSSLTIATAPAFDGDTNTNILAFNAGDVLAVGETANVKFEITFFPNYPATNFDNQAIAKGDSEEDLADGGAGFPTQDASDDQFPPDSNNNGDPTDDDDPTSIIVPIVGIAKAAGPVTAGTQEGTFDVQYTFAIENFGNADLYDVQVTDAITEGFGPLGTLGSLGLGEYAINVAPAVALPNLTDNAAFDGDGITPGDVNLLTLTTGDNLAIGESGNITVTITFFPDLTNDTLDYENEAVITANTEDDGTGTDVSDNSVDGTDPDGTDNDQNPDDESPTPITIPSEADISLTKAASTVVDNTDGTFNVTYSFALENTGNIPLYDVQIIDDLSGVFGTYENMLANLDNIGEYYTLPATITTNAVDAFTANTGFNGDAVTGILDVAAGGSLAINEVIEFELTVTFLPDLSMAPYSNSATTSGDSVPDGTAGNDVLGTTDISDDPADTTDVNTDGDPDDNPDDPTVINVPSTPAINTLKTVTDLTDNGDGTHTVTFTIDLENTGNVPLFDVQVQDDIATGFGNLVTGGLAATLTAGDYSVDPVTMTFIDVNNNSSLTLEPAFDGAANDQLIAFAAGDVLHKDDKAVLVLKVKFYPDFSSSASVNYENQAIATGDTVETLTSGDDPDGVDDASDDPINTTDVDPDGDNNPDDPTVVNVSINPQIGVAKNLDLLTELADGVFQADYTVTLANSGNVDLYDVQMIDDLTAGFGTLGTLGSLNSGQFVVSTAPATTFATLTANAAYNGDTDANLITLTTGDKLAVNDVALFTFSVTFKPDLNNAAIDYSNQITAIGDPVEDGTTGNDPNSVNDLSTDGLEPDPNNNGPEDNDDPTPIDLPINPVIGIAKGVQTIVDGAQLGSFDLTYVLTIENFGNVDLFDVQVTDDVSEGFGDLGTLGTLNAGEYAIHTAATTSLPNLTTNNSFDGDGTTPGNINLLTLTTGDSLAINETGTITFTINFFPDFSDTNLDYENQAIAEGNTLEDGTGETTTDNSVDGVDPDGDDNDDNPDEESPTPVDIPLDPQIAIAKAAIVTGRDISMVFTIKNTGNVALQNISLPDNLDDVFGAGNYTFNSITSSTGSLHNSSFDGSTVIELANNAFVLAVGDTQTITAEITLDTITDQGLGNGVYENQVTGTAQDPLGGPTEDDSTDGTDPDPEGDGPEDNDTPTPILVGSLELNKTLNYVRATGIEDQYEASFNFVIANNGGAVLDNIGLVDDFAGQNIAVTSIDSVSGSITTNEVVNTNTFTATTFDNSFISTPTGSAFIGGNAILDPSDSVTVTAVVVFTINQNLEDDNPIANSATANGSDENGGEVTDVSDDNTPTEDTDGDGDPGNDPLIIPIEPTGVIYDSSNGDPISGVVVELYANGVPVPAVCLVSGQQGQTTQADGEYRFDLILGNDAACPTSQADYEIIVTPPNGYSPQSQFILPYAPSFDTTGCGSPASLMHGLCEIGQQNPVTGGASGTGDFDYFTGFSVEQGDPAIANNHIPLDPAAENLLIRKKANIKAASLGDIITWTIEVQNNNDIDSVPATVVDNMPLGISYVSGTSVVMGVAQEPIINGTQLSWSVGVIPAQTTISITIATRITPSVVMGQLTNTVKAYDQDGNPISNTGEATVEIIPEAVFDCGEIIGQVFDDADLDGYQDKGEVGIAGVKLYTLKGLKITTDKHGKYHIPCAAIPNHQRGSNFVIKLDTDSLPTGYRMTTENPRVVRLTRGKMTKANFGANITNLVSVTLTDTIFEDCECYIRPKTQSDMVNLLHELVKRPSVLRVTYYANNADGNLATKRIEQFITTIKHIWEDVAEEPYRLEVEFDIVMDPEGPTRCIPGYTKPVEDIPAPVAPTTPKVEPAQPTPTPRPVVRQPREFRVFFKHDSYELSNTAKNILDEAKSYLNQYPYNDIELRGFADRSGDVDYNYGLSSNRLKIVKGYIGNHLPIEQKSYGEFNLPVITPDGVKELGNRTVIIRIK